MGRDLGRFVEGRRKELGMSRRDLADRAELSYPYVSQIETGDREPALKSLAALAGALGVGVSQLAELLSGEDWTGGSTQPRVLAMAAAEPPPPSEPSSSPPSAPPVDERTLYALERRLRQVPPLQRLVLLNRLIALTLEEMQPGGRG